MNEITDAFQFIMSTSFVLLAILLLSGALLASLTNYGISHRRKIDLALSLPRTDQEDRDLSSLNPIAVVIPTLDEASVLPKTVRHLFSRTTHGQGGEEYVPNNAPTVIIVDAGHDQETHAGLKQLLAQHPTLSLVQYQGQPSRGAQLNYGAAIANTVAPHASILLFLHADTLLPPNWDDSIRATLTSPNPPMLGTFTLSLPQPITTSMQVMLWGAKLRARFGKLPYGDQGYFMARRAFDAVGGFPSVPIMEDVELLRRVSPHGWIEVLDDLVETSPRRWKQKGVLWNTMLNQTLIAAWLCGVSHETIYRWYYGRRKSKVA